VVVAVKDFDVIGGTDCTRCELLAVCSANVGWLVEWNSDAGDRARFFT
jgi:hypothetical protein